MRLAGEVKTVHQPEVFEIDYTVTRTLKETYGKVVDTNSRTKANGLDWQTDVTWVERPPMGSIVTAAARSPASTSPSVRTLTSSTSRPVRALISSATRPLSSASPFGSSDWAP